MVKAVIGKQCLGLLNAVTGDTTGLAGKQLEALLHWHVNVTLAGRLRPASSASRHSALR